MKSAFSIKTIIALLEKATLHAVPPMSLTIAQHYPYNPYAMLISCLLSLRTKDTVTLPISLHLLSHACTPEQMLQLPIAQIESIVQSVNYYRRKAQIIHAVSAELINRFEGKVPDNLQDLLSIKGVGLKTANLVLAEAFGIPAICVDTHVHRISNRLGLVNTKTAEETEAALQQIIPKNYWIRWSRLLVMLGQSKRSYDGMPCLACPIRNHVSHDAI